MAKKVMLGTMLVAAATALASVQVKAEDVRTVGCSVNVSYFFNDALRSQYQKDFTVAPGLPFSDDFSTATRFRFFDASVVSGSDRSMTVTISYYNDVGVFDFVDFRTQLTLREDRLAETNQGTHTYFTSQGAAGERTTNYVLTCTRLKD